MGHRDLLVTHNLSDGEHHCCRPHSRGSVRRASGFVLTGNPSVEKLKLQTRDPTSVLPTIRPQRIRAETSRLPRLAVGLDNRLSVLPREDALAQPLVPSTAFADAWIQVDRTEDPRFFVNLLDATRARLLERARTSPREFFAPLTLRPGFNVLDVGCGTGDFLRLRF